jgi:Flp pilus assembly pilin Flp
VTRTLARILREDGGQDLIEYALITASISVIAVLAIASVGSAINVRIQALAADFAGS